jgi:hypothetical protein
MDLIELKNELAHINSKIQSAKRSVDKLTVVCSTQPLEELDYVCLQMEGLLNDVRAKLRGE